MLLKWGPSLFHAMMPVTTPDDVKRVAPANSLWLNVEVSLSLQKYTLYIFGYAKNIKKYSLISLVLNSFFLCLLLGV